MQPALESGIKVLELSILAHIPTLFIMFRWRILTMKKKKDSEEVCPCGRIITDSNNKTGLCPKCQKLGNSIGVSLGIVGAAFVAKKYRG